MAQGDKNTPKRAGPEPSLKITINNSEMGSQAQRGGRRWCEGLGDYEDEGEFVRVRVGVGLVEYQAWAGRLEKLPREECEELLVPESHRYDRPGVCGIHGTASVVLPRFSTTLALEIETHRARSSRFSEGELLSLCYRLLQPATFFQIRSERLGALSPQTILLKEGRVKVVNYYTRPSQPTNFSNAIEGEGRPLLSPEELACLARKDFYPVCIPGYDDCFVIGLVLLECATLRPSAEVVDIPRGVVKFGEVWARLAEADQHYQLLPRLVRLMLDAHRPCAGQLLYLLKPWETQLLTQQPFSLQLRKSLPFVEEFIEGWNEHF